LRYLVLYRGKRFGFEIKLTDAPRTTRSLRTAIADLGLSHSFVVYPGEDSDPLDHGIEALAASELTTIRERLDRLAS
jgi:hypothetical protein